MKKVESIVLFDNLSASTKSHCDRCIYNCTHPQYYKQEDDTLYPLHDRLVNALREKANLRSYLVGCVLGIDEWKVFNKQAVLNDTIIGKETITVYTRN